MGGLAWRAAVQAILLGACFLLPFQHLWAAPPEPTAAPSFAVEPSLVQPAAVDPRLALAVAVVFGVPSVGAFVVFVGRPGAGWRTLAAGSRPWLLLAALGLALLPSVVALATYPCCTSDVLDYIYRQRLWAVYGENPLSLTAAPQPADWSAGLAHLDAPFPYGPLWLLLARPFTQAATTLSAHLVGLKLLAAACFVVATGLVWQLAPAGHRLSSVVFFTWSPVLLIIGLIRLHNDLATVPFVLASVWCWRRQRWSAALGCAAAAALIKLTVGPVWLAVAVGLLGARRWRALGRGSAISLLLAALLYAPFWQGPATFAALLSVAQRSQWSVGSLLLAVLQQWLGARAELVLRGGLLVVAVLLTACCLRPLLVRPPGPRRLAGTAARLLLIWHLSVPLLFYPQYLLPIVALAAVADDRRLRWLVLAVSGAAMADSVLSVDSLAGGLQGAALVQAGSLVLVAGIGLGLAGWWWPQRQAGRPQQHQAADHAVADRGQPHGPQRQAEQIQRVDGQPADRQPLDRPLEAHVVGDGRQGDHRDEVVGVDGAGQTQQPQQQQPA